MNYLLSLPLIKLRFYFIAKEPIKLPWYKGGTFRGAFGQTFAQTVCLYRRNQCEKGCPIKEQCAYYYIFETPNNGELPEFVSEKAPRPFVIEPPHTSRQFYRPGEPFRMDLIILGKAIDYLPYFIYCFDRMGETRGVGKWTRDGYGRYFLEKVTQVTGGEENLIYTDQEIFTGNLTRTEAPLAENGHTESGDFLKITFLTPTRIKHHQVLVEKDRRQPLTFPMLLNDICWRSYLLMFFHHQRNLPPYEKLAAPELEVVDKQLKWRDWDRWTNRGRTKVRTGGFVGEIVFQGQWQPFYPLLKLGGNLHIGKQTTFGMGQFRVEVE